MGQGDGENATPLSSPQWTRGRRAAVEGVEINDHGFGASSCDNDEDRLDKDNTRPATFFDTETLCSRTGSLYHHLHPRPLHHYQHRLLHADRIDAQHAHAHPPASASPYAGERREPHLQPKPSWHLPIEPDADDMTIVGEPHDLGDQSFLLSRPTSLATMAISTTTTTDIIANTHTTPMSSLHSTWCIWHQDLQIELRLPTDAQYDDNKRSTPSDLQQYHDLLHEIDAECLLPANTLSSLDRRPSSSRSHLLQWRRNRSPGPDSSKYLRVSSDGRPPTPESLPLRTMTREEFEALPPTIQRKYFSTIERSQFTQYPDLESRSRLGSAGHDQLLSSWSLLTKPPTSFEHQERPATSDTPSLPSDRRQQASSTDQRFYANLPAKIKRRHLTEEELLIAHDLQTKISVEVLEEVPDSNNKRPLKDPKMQSSLSSPGLSDAQLFSSSQPRQGDRVGNGLDSRRPDSFYDSFRWLEEEEGLDLRLYLDDYHINLREEVPVPNKSRRPSFRRHLSINKLPFGRPSVSYSRPVPRDGVVSPTLISPSASQGSALGPTGHVRRKSRALSLISVNRQVPPHALHTIDPAATHYQDPEARMKLRTYLASPQKFDEALEFGFSGKDEKQSQETTMARGLEPSKDGVQEPDKLRSFLQDDRSSIYSDGASAAEPDSPKTPQLFDKSTPAQPVRTSSEHPASPKEDRSAQEQAASREMTLRMTLTRPDLRQSEEQIYGWKQHGGSRGGNNRDESATIPVIYARDGNSNPKESIERQLASFDQWGEGPNHDNGVVKRFWNRVKRT